MYINIHTCRHPEYTHRITILRVSQSDINILMYKGAFLKILQTKKSDHYISLRASDFFKKWIILKLYDIYMIFVFSIRK